MRIIKDSNGRYIGIKDSDGTRVPVPPSFVSGAESLPPAAEAIQAQATQPPMPSSPYDTSDPAERMFVNPTEQGVSLPERTLLKNWTSTPEKAAAKLAEWGYDVRPYGNHIGKMQFAVRPRGKSGVWRVLDPEGFDWQDLLDHGGDLTAGVFQAAGAIGGATLGGLPGEAAGSALGSATGEMVRQEVGAASGLEGNEDIGPVKESAIVGGAVPIVAKLASPLLRPAGKAIAYGFERAGGALRYAAARIAGVKPLANMGLKEAINIVQNNAGRKIVPIAEQAAALQRIMFDPKSGLMNTTWPEVEKISNLLVNAGEQGAKLDMMPILDNIENMARQTGGGMIERRAAAEARPTALDEIYDNIRQNPLYTPGEDVLRAEPKLADFYAREQAQFRSSTMTNAMSKEAATSMSEAQAGQTGYFRPAVAQLAGRDLERRAFPERFIETVGGEPGAETIPMNVQTQPMAGRIGPANQPIPGMSDFIDQPLESKVGGLAAEARAAVPEGSIANAPEGRPEPEFMRRFRAGEPGVSKEAAAAEERQPGARKQVLSLLNFLVGRIEKAGFNPGEVPLDLAHFLKTEIQAVARKGGAYAGQEVGEPFARVARDAAHDLRAALVEAMPAETKGELQDAMESFEGKTKLRQAIVNSFRTPADVESFLRNVHGKSNSAALIHLRGLEQHFGMSIVPELEAARAAELMNHPNPGLELMRRHPFMAAGAIFRPEAGAAVLGVPAALPAAAKGLEVVGRGVRAGTGLAANVAEKVADSALTKSAAVAAFQEAVKGSGKGIVSESQASTESRRRNRVTKLF